MNLDNDQRTMLAGFLVVLGLLQVVLWLIMNGVLE